MKNIIYALVIIAALGIASCSKPMSRYDKELTDAETIMQDNADSAMSILEAIDLSDLKNDSLRAKYIFLKAYGHMKQNRSMVSDSLISLANFFLSRQKYIERY